MEDFFKNPVFRKVFKYFVILFLVCLITPLISMYFISTNIDDSKMNNIINSISGIAIPLIAIVAAFLSFMAFWIQYQANIKILDYSKSQLIEVNNDRELTAYINELSLTYDMIKQIKSSFNINNLDIATSNNQLNLCLKYYESSFENNFNKTNYPQTYFTLQVKYFMNLNYFIISEIDKFNLYNQNNSKKQDLEDLRNSICNYIKLLDNVIEKIKDSTIAY